MGHESLGSHQAFFKVLMSPEIRKPLPLSTAKLIKNVEVIELLIIFNKNWHIVLK